MSRDVGFPSEPGASPGLVLQPYTTLDGVQLLAANLWDAIGPDTALPSGRFFARCKYSQAGQIKQTSVRWKRDGAWYDANGDLFAGVVSGCSVETMPRRSEVEIDVSAGEEEGAACASDVDLLGLRCELNADRKPWPDIQPQSDRAGALRSPLLRPHRTTRGAPLLAAYFWREVAKYPPRGVKRFTARCMFDATGPVSGVAARFSKSDPLRGEDAIKYAGVLSNCAVDALAFQREIVLTLKVKAAPSGLSCTLPNANFDCTWDPATLTEP